MDGNGSRDEIELSLDTNSITGVGYRVQNSSQVYRTFGLRIVLRGISPFMMMITRLHLFLMPSLYYPIVTVRFDLV